MPNKKKSNAKPAIKRPADRPLSFLQQKFVELYDGNGTKTARLAGYKGNANTLSQTAFELLRLPKIIQAIKARDAAKMNRAIADRRARQQFWTEVMEDETNPLAERLRASELLGRSGADFVERREITGADGAPLIPDSKIDVSQLSDEQLKALSKVNVST